MAKYLGTDALGQLLTLIKSNFVKKEKVTGDNSREKILTDNNFTDTLRDSYNTHIASSHAPANAQPNIIESITVNGTEVTPSITKGVSLEIPELSNSISADDQNSAVTPHAVIEYVRTHGGAGGTGISFTILTESEYNASTKIPNIVGLENTIYLVPQGGADSNNTYIEYLYINNKFECIGSTAIDLSNYLTKSDVEAITIAEVNSAWTRVIASTV